MSYKIVATKIFKRSLKPIAKKHRSLKNDLANLIDSLKEEPTQGIRITENCYKIRMAITSKGRGKSGGARVFTYVRIVDEIVYLAEIFDKSDKDNLSEKEIDDAFGFIQSLDEEE